MSLKYITAPKKFRRYISIGALMVFGAVATGFQFWNVLNSYTVRSSSMQPTLLVGDQIVVESLGDVPPKRGEIILFSQPNNGNSTQKTTDLLRMKRIIAIAGDTIELKNNQIFLNDVPIQQETKEETTLLTGRCYPYKFFQYQEELDGIQYSILITSASLSSNYAHMEKKTVPKDHVFVLGDNRDNSADSRVWGFVSADKIEGRATNVLYSFDTCSGEFRPERKKLIIQ